MFMNGCIAKKLADELYDAAEKFRIDFERAQLSGNYARLERSSVLRSLNVGQVSVTSMVLAVALLVIGGLLQKKAAGSSAFKLALLVSRLCLLLLRPSPSP